MLAVSEAARVHQSPQWHRGMATGSRAQQLVMMLKERDEREGNW
jgi:hypothetical protein